MSSGRAIDISEWVIGACVLALPLAVTQEVWDLSVEIPIFNVVMIALFSCLILWAFIFLVQGVPDKPPSNMSKLHRVIGTYGVTLLTCALVLLLLNKFPILEDPVVAIKRTVLIAFPASFAATVVDHLR